MSDESELEQRIPRLAAQALERALRSGLRWDEVVTALGMAIRAISKYAAFRGDGTEADCLDLAREWLDDVLTQAVDIWHSID